MAEKVDTIIIGAGHNGLVASIILAKAGLKVLVLEDKSMSGGAAKTEYPFKKAPGLGASTGAYLLGLMPPELLRELEIDIELKKRDPHYFLPTNSQKYLLFGSDHISLETQFKDFFSEQDFLAHQHLQEEISAIRDDIAPSWMREPKSIEESAESYIRPHLRQNFIDLCRKPISHYLDRFNFKSDLVKAMYAVTDAFSGLNGGYDTPGTGMNFLIHNMCRLPTSDGTWMVAKGGMGAVTQALEKKARSLGVGFEFDTQVAQIEVVAGCIQSVTDQQGNIYSADNIISNADPFRMQNLLPKDALPSWYQEKLAGYKKDGTTLKVNLALRDLPQFTCLKEKLGQHHTTIHILPQENILESLRTSFSDAENGILPDFPTIEWYMHTTIDPSLTDDQGHHNSALFVQWVPYQLRNSTWEKEEDKYVKHLLSICQRFAPNTEDIVVDTFALPPSKIESHFGISRGHIHHIDNSFGFSDRLPYRTPIDGLYSCSAGCHPAGSVIGAAGYNAARRVLKDLGKISQ